MKSLVQIVEAIKPMNYAEVARELKVTRAYISAIANGTRVNPSYAMTKKLSDYLEGKEDK